VLFTEFLSEDKSPSEGRNLSQTALSQIKKEASMLNWSITFFIVALIAAILGFSGIAASAAGIAKVLFFLFLVLFVISLFTRRAPV
jgi:uncharacterized membrane protein YtjA (UPF0391 family)